MQSFYLIKRQEWSLVEYSTLANLPVRSKITLCLIGYAFYLFLSTPVPFWICRGHVRLVGRLRLKA